MVAFALLLHLAAATPALPVAPPLEAGPFEVGELAASGLGALAGDLLVVGAGWATLQLFANGVIASDAHEFRNAAFVLAGTALIVPPLTAALLGRLARTSPASGSFWKAFALAAAGHAIALAATAAAAPNYWVFLPVQLVAVASGTSVGLHWGPRLRVPARPAVEARPPAAAPLALAYPVCPDG